ncbi:hypothetical protein BDF20DRAFT_885240 [Mycotypha africana]|uniref:uncharacterized protein n=1 Tax=Mycotypha africana TaxID=64632 RepID=UPI0023015BD0|nr:uncharacterized protein BDF20DRAFT_885240 [Mycotypha africana]KAI8971598.1 hypothetical protein BDF20DRAFT_885240 [Mycotypha africana]
MAVGTLIVHPENLLGLPSDLAHDARIFVGCFVRENDKHRTHSESGPEPYWKESLNCEVRESDDHLNIEIVNESPSNGGILASAKVPLEPVFNLGTEQKTVDLNSHGRPVGQLRLKLTFNGSHSTGSVTTSFGNMNLAGGGNASYQQTASYSHTTSHHVSSDSRQSSYSSLGPANPIPDNYGAGSPPPFTPPVGAAAAYPGKGNTSMPAAPPVNNVMNAEGVVDPKKMSKDEFEEAKARGNLPTWAVRFLFYHFFYFWLFYY